jgi:hypothetical protein
MSAVAFVKPYITGCERKLIILPNLSSPKTIIVMPSIKVKVIVYARYASLPGGARGDTAVKVIKDKTATGPVDS